MHEPRRRYVPERMPQRAVRRDYGAMRTIEGVPLGSATAHHGGKATGLSALLTAGLPVPPGVVFDAAPSASAAGIASAAVEVAHEYGWRALSVCGSVDAAAGPASSPDARRKSSTSLWPGYRTPKSRAGSS